MSSYVVRGFNCFDCANSAAPGTLTILRPNQPDSLSPPVVDGSAVGKRRNCPPASMYYRRCCHKTQTVNYGNNACIIEHLGLDEGVAKFIRNR
jgi:hypothetical protein